MKKSNSSKQNFIHLKKKKKLSKKKTNLKIKKKKTILPTKKIHSNSELNIQQQIVKNQLTTKIFGNVI